MTNELAKRDNADMQPIGTILDSTAVRRPPTPDEIRGALMPQNYAECAKLATAFFRSRMYKIQSEDQAMVVLLTGMDLGVTPSVAFRSINVIDGKPCPSADLFVACCKKRPDVCEWFRLIESTDMIATYETKRVGDPPVTMSFTHDQAAGAGLLNKDNWRKYKAAMLRSRASAALARAVYQDLCLGLYTPDEIKGGDVELRMELGDEESEAVAQIEAPAHVEAEVVQRPMPPRTEPIADEAARLGAESQPGRESTADKVLRAQVLGHLLRVYGDKSVPDAQERIFEFLRAYGYAGPTIPKVLATVPIPELQDWMGTLAATPDYGTKLAEPDPAPDEADAAPIDDPFAEGPTALNN